MWTRKVSTSCPQAISTRPAISAIATSGGGCFAGRAHDVIKTGGYKLYPEEIERVLPENVVVLGIPSVHWGEVIVAVSEGDGDLTQTVADATRGLARYKQPRACLTIEKIPRSLQGKVQRARVRELVLARYVMTDGPYPKFEAR